MGENDILNKIRSFSDGEKIALMLTIVSDVSDGELHDDEWNFIGSNLIKVQKDFELLNHPNLLEAMNVTKSNSKISKEEIKNNGHQILDILITENDLVNIGNWWREVWNPFFYTDTGNRMDFFGDRLVPLFRKLFLSKSDIVRKWVHGLCNGVLKTVDSGKDANEIKQGWALNFPNDIACGVNPVKITSTLESENGIVYKGEMICGIYHGRGSLTWSNGNNYEGDFVCGECHGKGRFSWVNGEKYEGDYESNEINGKGTYYWPNGDKYEGNFYYSDRDGEGVYTCFNGDRFEGVFEMGEISGEGTYFWNDGNSVKLIEKNLAKTEPDSLIKLIESRLSQNDNPQEELFLKLSFHPKVDSSDLLEVALKNNINSKLFKALLNREILDTEVKEIVDLKMMIKEEKLSYEELSKKNFSKNIFKSLLIESEKIITACLENKYFPIKMLAEAFHSENTTFEQKMSIASNKGLTSEIFKDISRDKENYLSSRLRKAVALNSSCPKDVTDELLSDEYRWVREAAASHKNITNDEISMVIKNLEKDSKDRYLLNGFLINSNCSNENVDILKELLKDEVKYPRQYNEYQLGFDSNVFPSEQCAGTVSNEDMASCIVEYEGDWSSFMYDNNWYDFEDLYHTYGMNCPATHVEYPDGIKLPININPKSDPEDSDFDIYNYGNKIVCQTFSYEKGYGWKGWNRYVGKLEYELISEKIEPSFDLGICDSYYYKSINLDGTTDECEEFESTDDYSTTGKGTDFEVNVDPLEIINEMEENKKDPTNLDEVLAWLKLYYNLDES